MLFRYLVVDIKMIYMDVLLFIFEKYLYDCK